MNNFEIKNFIAVLLKDNNTHADAHEILDTINDAETKVELVSSNIVKKYTELGVETIPRIGFTNCINNDWWEMQDPNLKQLFPELTNSSNLEFLIMVIEDVVYNKKVGKVEITERRYFFRAE